MLPHLTLPDILKSISLLASEDGVTLSDLPDGLIAARFGLAVAPVNLSARQAKAAGLLMSGIYGPLPIGLSRSADLSRSLGNRLQARMDSRGSTLFRLTWKLRHTPSGRSISALRASVLRTSANACTGVATPSARDYKSNQSSEDFQKKQWNHPRGKPLSAQVTLADFGETPIGGRVETKNIGQLNPDYSRWLMGFPAAWGNSVDMGMQLSRHLQQRLSVRRRKSSK